MKKSMLRMRAYETLREEPVELFLKNAKSICLNMKRGRAINEAAVRESYRER